MTAVLIIAGIVAAILIIKAINAGKQKENNSELQEILNKMQKEIYPNGQQDIDKGTKELLRILNYSIDEKTAQSIFMKSSSVCYTSSMNNDFSKERLKLHLSPYALHYFDDTSLGNFYDLLSKNKKGNDLNRLLELSGKTSQSSNPTGTIKDQIPEGYGEFGLEITNPIPASSIPDGYFYLSKLRTQDGYEITYDRIGSMSAPNIKDIVDGYRISVKGSEVATVYICPYSVSTSSKAPKGFKLI